MGKAVLIVGSLLLIQAAAFPGEAWAGGKMPPRKRPAPPVVAPPAPPVVVRPPPAPPVVAPPQPAPAQPWLVRGKGHSGSYIVTPSGEVVKE